MQTHAPEKFSNNERENEADLVLPKNFNAYDSYSEEDSAPNQLVEINDDTKSKNNLSPKLIFGVLLFLGAVTIFFGFLNLTKTIYGPSVAFNQNQLANLEEAQESRVINEILELQNRDTDGDGLSDYEEIYIYGTSPYLADTDGDGYTDKQEIDGGFDPLCPKGQDCRGFGEDTTWGTVQEIADGQSEFDQQADQTNSAEIPQDILEQLRTLTPNDVRELLLSSEQMTQEELDAIDDNLLMEIYYEALNNEF